VNSQRRGATPAATLGRPPADTIPNIEQITVTVRMADGSVTVIDMLKPSDAQVDYVVEEAPLDDSYFGFAPYWQDRPKQTFTLTVDLNREADPTLVIQLDPPPDASQQLPADAAAALHDTIRGAATAGAVLRETTWHQPGGAVHRDIETADHPGAATITAHATRRPDGHTDTTVIRPADTAAPDALALLQAITERTEATQ
jgi:hypothetical protein